MRCVLCGDGETEPSMDQVTLLVQEICKEDVIALMIHKLAILGWEVSSIFGGILRTLSGVWLN